MHKMLGRVVCMQSDYKAKGNKQFRHTSSIHKGVKFSCDQCDYKATQKGNLLSHIKAIHEGIKISCDQCDYKATQKGNLLSHIKAIHEGVWLNMPFHMMTFCPIYP